MPNDSLLVTASFTDAEAKSLLPAKPAVGSTFAVPEPVARRLEASRLRPASAAELSFAGVTAVTGRMRDHLAVLTDEVWQLERRVTSGDDGTADRPTPAAVFEERPQCSDRSRCDPGLRRRVNHPSSATPPSVSIQVSGSGTLLTLKAVTVGIPSLNGVEAPKGVGAVKGAALGTPCNPFGREGSARGCGNAPGGPGSCGASARVARAPSTEMFPQT